ncbi:MAG: DUF58 domain-containing protein, partial [Verrucomicrobia bacterium]
MIVPQNKLLFWFAAVVLPFALLAAVEPATMLIGFIFIGGFIVVALADAWRATSSFHGIRVELPDVARMSKDRESRLDLRIGNELKQARTLRLGLAWPREIESAQEDMTVELPAGSEWSKLSWTCVPRKRGSFPIESVYAESASPLGFWAARKTLPGKSEVRVYPNLLTDRKNLAVLFLNRGAFGLHAQRQVGKGRDFEKLREYVPGDSFDEIHWKATARRARPITKVFQIEKTQEIYVVIDASRLSARTPERAIVSSQRSMATDAGQQSP